MYMVRSSAENNEERKNENYKGIMACNVPKLKLSKKSTYTLGLLYIP